MRSTWKVLWEVDPHTTSGELSFKANSRGEAEDIAMHLLLNEFEDIVNLQFIEECDEED